jgi:hypothetical protein
MVEMYRASRHRCLPDLQVVDWFVVNYLQVPVLENSILESEKGRTDVHFAMLFSLAHPERIALSCSERCRQHPDFAEYLENASEETI